MDRTKNTFMGLFGSEARRLLLLIFCLNPEKEFYARELEKKIGINVGNIARELKKIESAGLITAKKIGNVITFQANTNSPVFNHFKELVIKIIGAEELLRPIFTKEKSIRLAFIYGSYAMGDFEAESDIDLMIIANLDDSSYENIQDAINGIENKIGREINTDVMSEKEFNEKFRKKDGYLSNVLSNKKIFIIGDDDELRLLTGKKNQAGF